MQPKNLSRRALLITFILVGIFSLICIFWPGLKSSVVKEPLILAENVAVPVKPEIITYGLPVRLIIPAINVDAIVEDVGVVSNGEMGIPAGPNNVAWFKFGPRPGERGSAVIDGHYGWKDNIPAVFDNLKKLHKDDKLSVEDDQGVIVTFVVREIREYAPSADDSAVFGSSDGKAHLNLITCDGPWNRNTVSRPTRLVVFADKE